MDRYEKISFFYKALGDPVRIRIVEYLLDRGTCACICELASRLDKDQSVIFRHIQLLKQAGIIITDKRDKMLFCCVKEKSRIRSLLEA